MDLYITKQITVLLHIWVSIQDNGGGTYGDLVFGTRNTTNKTTVPTERMRIRSNGNVGIGTTNPSEKLTVQDDVTPRVAMFRRPSATSYLFCWENSNSLAYMGIDGQGLCNFEPGALLMGVWRDKPIIFTTGQSNTEKMRINSNGNVGIGNTNPSYKLDVVGTTRFTDKMLVGTTVGNADAKDCITHIFISVEYTIKNIILLQHIN